MNIKDLENLKPESYYHDGFERLPKEFLKFEFYDTLFWISRQKIKSDTNIKSDEYYESLALDCSIESSKYQKEIKAVLERLHQDLEEFKTENQNLASSEKRKINRFQINLKRNIKVFEKSLLKSKIYRQAISLSTEHLRELLDREDLEKHPFIKARGLKIFSRLDKTNAVKYLEEAIIILVEKGGFYHHKVYKYFKELEKNSEGLPEEKQDFIKKCTQNLAEFFNFLPNSKDMMKELI